MERSRFETRIAGSVPLLSPFSVQLVGVERGSSGAQRATVQNQNKWPKRHSFWSALVLTREVEDHDLPALASLNLARGCLAKVNSIAQDRATAALGTYTDSSKKLAVG
jgi:hypothetical protein